MAYCKYCGAWLDPQDQFCSSCGQAVSAEEEKASYVEEEPYEEPLGGDPFEKVPEEIPLTYTLVRKQCRSPMMIVTAALCSAFSLWVLADQLPRLPGLFEQMQYAFKLSDKFGVMQIAQIVVCIMIIAAFISLPLRLWFTVAAAVQGRELVSHVNGLHKSSRSLSNISLVSLIGFFLSPGGMFGYAVDNGVFASPKASESFIMIVVFFIAAAIVFSIIGSMFSTMLYALNNGHQRSDSPHGIVPSIVSFLTAIVLSVYAMSEPIREETFFHPLRYLVGEPSVSLMLTIAVFVCVGLTALFYYIHSVCYEREGI